jgi:hypothetical protein
MALGFDIPDKYLLKVQYTKQRAKVTFDSKTRKIVNGAQLIDKLIRTKFNDWQYEDEYRTQIDVIPKKQSVSWILSDGGWWLWSVETGRELHRLPSRNLGIPNSNGEFGPGCSPQPPPPRAKLTR